jgi:protease IV
MAGIGKRMATAVGAAWRGLGALKRFTGNLLFLALVVALLAWWWTSGPPKVPKGGALLVAPVGAIVEQRAVVDPFASLNPLGPRAPAPQTLLRDLVDAIEAAREDDRIEILALDLSRMGSAGMTKLRDLRSAIEAFRASGKKVVAYADLYDQSRYHVAAAADEVWMHSRGWAAFEGFGSFRMYFKEGMDRLGVEMHVFRVGEYKSAVEPFLLDGPSPEAREMDADWLGDLWHGWLDDVAAARGTTPEAISDYVDGFGDKLAAAGGLASKAALDAGIVDRVGSRDEIRDRLIELAGEDKKLRSFRRIGVSDYLKRLGNRRPGARPRGDQVAVIVAVGNIEGGTRPPGAIGGDSTAELIRKARQDRKVKALVLRVDSGGGSAFASEVIRRELQLARDAGKPVVVSMGTVAASGGYLISLASDEIWASPVTITGSIGIFGMFPTYDKALARHLGVRVDGAGTTPFAGALRPDRPLQPEVGRVIQMIVDEGYREFVGKVAESRGKPFEEIDPIARGRVWSGEDAHRLGLVDRLGGLQEAVASAAEKAGIADKYTLRWVERKPTVRERLSRRFATRVLGEARERTESLPGYLAAPVAQLRPASRELELLKALEDPYGIYAHCLCVPE